MQDGPAGRRDAGDRADAAQPERLERRELEAADRLRDVDERVGVSRVAVVGGVRQEARADRVEDDDERAARDQGLGFRRRSERTSGRNASVSTRLKSAAGAVASTTISPPNA